MRKVLGMELRTLRYFVAVADTGSVTAAAQQVHVAQPSLSRQLRRLESELRLSLFQRDGSRLVLSPAGSQFLAVARDLLGRADAAVEAAAALAAGRLDRVRIAAPPTTMTDVIAPFLATLRREDPFPSVTEHDPAAVYQALSHGADLAISTQQPPHRYACQLLAVLPVWLYVRADHPWAARSSVGLAELAGEPLLLLPASYKPRQLIDQAAEEAGVRLTVSETGSAEVAQALTAAGRGMAVVSDDSRFGLRGLRIVAPSGELLLQLHAGWDPEHHARGALAALAGRISRFCIDRYGPQAAPPSPK
jgi:DNA-binding transcriptional LysR family regulator